MKKSFKNEVVKRKYFNYLGECKGYSESSIDAYERSIILWQECHENKDFSGFGKQQSVVFKRWLKIRQNPKGQVVSLSYQYNILQRLKKFFEWLSMQPHYKSKINYSTIEYLSLSKTETSIARQPNKRDIPSMDEVSKVIETIKIKSDVDRRDRALLSLALLTGARISALTSLPMKSFDKDSLSIDQNPKFGTKTKYSKNIITRFFPIKYQEAQKYFLRWFKYLKEEKGFKADDPIFPQAVIENGEKNISFFNTGEVEPVFWKSSQSTRKVFQKRFEDAGIPYYNPHSFRHLIVKELAKTRLTEEQKKAISQNLGHKNVGTTFGSYGYGHIQEDRQIDIVKNIKIENEEIEGESILNESQIDALAKALKKKL